MTWLMTTFSMHSLVKKTGFSHSYKRSLWIVRVHYFRYLFSLGWTHVFFPVQKHVENRDTNCDKTIMKYGQCISTFQILVYQHSCQHHGTTSKMKEHLHGFHLKHIYSIVLVVHEWTTSNYIIKTVLCVLNPSMFQSIAWSISFQRASSKSPLEFLGLRTPQHSRWMHPIQSISFPTNRFRPSSPKATAAKAFVSKATKRGSKASGGATGSLPDSTSGASYWTLVS